MRRKKLKYSVCACVLVYLCYVFGLGDYIYMKNFNSSFNYPLNVDIEPAVEEVLGGQKPSINPINYYPYRFLSNSGKCRILQQIDLVIVVKSAMNNFGHREAIRQTYGQENHIPGKVLKTLFFLGIDGSRKSENQKNIDLEMAKYKDIIQIDFLDTYFNNTIKTMMSFRWVFEHCSTAKFYFFTDDDMYISVTNLLEYLNNINKDSSKDLDDIELPSTTDVTNSEREKHIFAGYVFKSAPQRFRTSKWRVTLDEYPWDRWPPYVTAAAYVLSNKTMKTLYAASLFVKHFRFDDIYLGIVAKKVGVTPIHCPQFHFYKKKYSIQGYRDVIASHGFGDHEELIRLWNEQNSLVAVQ